MVLYTFGILKETRREFSTKTKLNVVYIPDVITICVILYNILQRHTNEDLEVLCAMISDSGHEDDGDLDEEVYNASDDLHPQRLSQNHGEALHPSLANYFDSQRGVGL